MTNDPNDTPEQQPDNPLRDALRRVQAEQNGEIPRVDLYVDDTGRTPTVDPSEIETSPLRKERKPQNGDRRVRRLGEKVERDTRQILRRVQAHLIEAHIGMGAQHMTVDLTEVIFHSTNPTASLNYITPRRKTAWISAEQIERGLDALRAQGRAPRLRYIEGLYPPLFARSLDKLDLAVESEIPLMIYEAGEDVIQPARAERHNIRVETVQDVRGMEVWWYVWRNAHYDVLTLGVEPLRVGRDMAAVTMGRQIDVIAYQGEFPFGVARITRHEETAHIAGIAVFREMRNKANLRLLTEHAVAAALDSGAKLVFMPGEADDDRAAARALGFVDFGSVVCYAAKSELETSQGSDDDTLAQPVLDFRPNLT